MRYGVILLSLTYVTSTSPAAASDTVGQIISLISQPRNERCIDVPYGQFAAGRLLELHPCRFQINQIFTYTPNREIKIAGHCVDAYRPGGGPSQAGDQVGLWTCHGGPNQRWTRKFVQGLGTRFFVQGVGGQELCLDVVGGRNVDGARLTINPCNNNPSQVFWEDGYNRWPYWNTPGQSSRSR